MIISVKNISKKYNITCQKGGYVALRDVLTNIANSLDNIIYFDILKLTKTTRSVPFWEHGGFFII